MVGVPWMHREDGWAHPSACEAPDTRDSVECPWPGQREKGAGVRAQAPASDAWMQSPLQTKMQGPG